MPKSSALKWPTGAGEDIRYRPDPCPTKRPAEETHPVRFGSAGVSTARGQPPWSGGRSPLRGAVYARTPARVARKTTG